MDSNFEKKVFFITGCSKGFGLILSKLCLKKGHCVASTSRSMSELLNSFDDFISNDNFLPLEVDLNNEESIKNAVDKTIKTFGHIDVLINNAGYSLLGTLEELSNKEIKDNFDCNVFGLINVTRQILPHFRSCEESLKRIVNISSILGFYGRTPGYSIYSSTKFAVESITEGLHEDAKEFGIHVSSVKPGYFKTNFFEPTTIRAPINPINDYTRVRESCKFHQTMKDNQLGDPLKGSEAIIQHSLSKSPSYHLFLGSDTLKFSKNKLDELHNDIKSNYDITSSTDAN